MDHEPEDGSVGPCGDLGSGYWPLSLAECGFPGEGEALLPWQGMLVIFCAVGRQIGKPKAWFLEVLNVAFHFQVCLINIPESL